MKSNYQNYKFQMTISKSQINPNIQMPITKHRGLIIEYWNLNIVWKLELGA